MIYFLVRGQGRLPISLFLTDRGKTLAPRMRVIDYDSLFRMRRLPVGSYIFSSLDCLTTAELEKLSLCWRLLSEYESDVRLLNHPLRAMKRYELLRALHESDVNEFDVYRLTEHRTPERFPVFLRHEDEHEGAVTGLLNDQGALDGAIASLVNRGEARENSIIVEFLGSPGEAGLYRKYGAFSVGGQIIPRHLQVSRDWMVKGNSKDVTPEIVEEERDYVESNPHEAELRKIFALANIDYGRIDYTVRNGRIQVFEINMNPQIAKPGRSRETERTPVKELFSQRLVDALAGLDSPLPARSHVPIRFDSRPFHKRRPGFVEFFMRIARLPGLARFGPWIFRTLRAVRGLWH